MKRPIFVLSMLISFVFIACSYQKKLGIDMPQGFDKERKAQIVQQFTAGKKAYITHCARCHNKTLNGKEVIPDISFEQADTYKVRFNNNQHKAELTTETVTEKELDMIVIFFAYKKQTGVAMFESSQ